MPTDNGYSNQKKKGLAQFETVHNLGSGAHGKSVAPKSLYEITASAAIVSVTDIKGSNGQVEYWNIELTGHGASVGNIFRIDAGTLINSEYEILQVIDANNFYILPITDVKPAAAMTAVILGWVTNKVAADGSINVAITSAPTQFNYDGVPQTVEQDTAVPANNRALPNLNFIIKDGVQVPVTKNTGTPANTIGMPVEIVAASGTPINITAGDINVQLSDQGANFDSLRVGDGSGNYIDVSVHTDPAEANGIHIHGERMDNATLDVAPSRGAEGDALRVLADPFGQIRNFDQFNYDELSQLRQNLLTMSGKLPATLGQKAEVDSLSVTLSTENETVLNTILTEIGEINTDTPALVGGRVPVDGSGVTQPISAASLPLPSGAATEATLASIDGKLPATLGQKTSTASLAVVISSDQSALPVTETALTATYQEDLTVTSAAAETFTAPAGAKWCKIQADDANTGNMRVKIGGTATVSSGIQFQPGRSEDYSAVGNISYIMETGFTGKIYVQFGS